MSIIRRTSKRSPCLRTSVKSFSPMVCGSCSRWIAAKEAAASPAGFFFALACARLSLRSVRFELRALVAPSFFRFFCMRSAVLAAAVPASSSSESAALAWSCAPSRKCSAATRSAECGQKSAPLSKKKALIL